MLLRLRVAFRKEFLQFSRSRVLIVLVLYMFAEIALCAWALTMDIRDLPLLVVDNDQSQASRALTERFRIAPYFDFHRAAGGADPQTALLRGEATLVMVIPPGLARALDRGETAHVQLLADGAYSNFSALALSHAAEIVQQFNADLQRDAALWSGQAVAFAAVENRVRVWYMPGLEYTHFQLVFMLGTSALLLGVLLPAAAIVREKEAGTIEQLLVTPLQPWEFVVAKLAPMGMLMAAGLGIGLLEARLLFDVPVRGSLLLFFGLSLMLFFSAMGLGAYIGAITRNLQQTMLLTFALLFPMVFLSGAIGPIEQMPVVIQLLTLLSPLRFFLPIARGILFKGVGLEVLAPNVAALAIYGLVLMTIGVRQLRRTLAA